jgi:hypothetical protein
LNSKILELEHKIITKYPGLVPYLVPVSEPQIFQFLFISTAFTMSKAARTTRDVLQPLKYLFIKSSFQCNFYEPEQYKYFTLIGLN